MIPRPRKVSRSLAPDNIDLDITTAEGAPYRGEISNADDATRSREISTTAGSGVARLPSYTSSRRQVYGYLSHLQLVALLLARGISAIPRGTHAACVHTYLRLR